MKIIIANTYKRVLYLIQTYVLCKFLSHREITLFFTFFFFNKSEVFNKLSFFFLRTRKCGFIFLFCFNLNLFIFFKLFELEFL